MTHTEAREDTASDSQSLPTQHTMAFKPQQKRTIICLYQRQKEYSS